MRQVHLISKINFIYKANYCVHRFLILLLALEAVCAKIICNYNERFWTGHESLYACAGKNLDSSQMNETLNRYDGNHTTNSSNQDVKAFVMESLDAISIPSGVGSRFPNLLTFQIMHSNLSGISKENFEDMKQLKRLRLSFDGLREIPRDAFSEIQSLERLFLDNNRIHSLSFGTFASLKDLKYLNLTSNDLTYLLRGIFSNNRQLEEVYFAHNKLSFVSSNLFEGLNQIRIIDLRDNLCINYLAKQKTQRAEMKQHLETCEINAVGENYDSSWIGNRGRLIDHRIFKLFFGYWSF